MRPRPTSTRNWKTGDFVTTPLWAKAFEYTPAGAQLSVLAAHRFRLDHPVQDEEFLR